jgi:hypothetical protein
MTLDNNMESYFQVKVPLLPNTYQSSLAVCFLRNWRVQQDSKILVALALSFNSINNKILFTNPTQIVRLNMEKIFRCSIERDTAEIQLEKYSKEM